MTQETNKQTNKQTNKRDNNTKYEEEICYVLYKSLMKYMDDGSDIREIINK
jgi:hypothetical protein